MSASLDLVYRTAARLGVKLEEAALVRPDFASGRGYWQAGQSGLNPQRLVFVDGRALTAVDGGATNMVRRYGRGLRGRRVVDRVPNVHCTSTTFVATLTHRSFFIPYVTERAMKGAIVRVWTERMPAPELRSGDAVIMDKLGRPPGQHR